MPGRPIPGYIGPYVDPFNKIQDAFGNTSYERNPIDNEFLLFFVPYLEEFFGEVIRDVNFVTSDGRMWTGINFPFDNHWYKLLLPRHEGKTNTGLVSLYCKREPSLDEVALDEEINAVAQAVVSKFFEARTDHYANKPR